MICMINCLNWDFNKIGLKKLCLVVKQNNLENCNKIVTKFFGKTKISFPPISNTKPTSVALEYTTSLTLLPDFHKYNEVMRFLSGVEISL